MKNNNNRNIFQILTKASEVILITGLTAGFTSPAEAKQFNFSYSGLGVDASGVLTTDEIPNSSGYFTVTDINGQRNGATITALLPPESFPPNPPNPPFTFSNNNLISPKEPFVDFSGICSWCQMTSALTSNQKIK